MQLAQMVNPGGLSPGGLPTFQGPLPTFQGPLPTFQGGFGADAPQAPPTGTQTAWMLGLTALFILGTAVGVGLWIHRAGR